MYLSVLKVQAVVRPQGVGMWLGGRALARTLCTVLSAVPSSINKTERSKTPLGALTTSKPIA